MIYGGARRTGKTTRMLLDAANYAVEHKTVVFVICANFNEVPHMVCILKHFMQINQPCRDVVDIANVGTIRFIASGNPDIDWSSGRIHSYNSRVFIDHYVVERRFGWVLNEWLKYNEK